jgi:hypothetical protein
MILDVLDDNAIEGDRGKSVHISDSIYYALQDL